MAGLPGESALISYPTPLDFFLHLFWKKAFVNKSREFLVSR